MILIIIIIIYFIFEKEKLFGFVNVVEAHPKLRESIMQRWVGSTFGAWCTRNSGGGP